MRAPRLRYSLLSLFLLTAIVAVGLLFVQRHLAWQAAEKQFAELILIYDTKPEDLLAAERLVTRYPQLAQRKGALWWAIRFADSETCRILLEHGADPNETDIYQVPALVYALNENKPDVLQELIDAHADPNIRIVEYTYDWRGISVELTPLQQAARRGYLRCAEILLAAGADVNARTNEGTTVLHFAAASTNIPLAELLLANGAKYREDDEGRTPSAYLRLLDRQWRRNIMYNAKKYDPMLEFLAEEEQRWLDEHPDAPSASLGAALP